MDRRLFAAHGWEIVENTLPGEHMRFSESIMSLGNGYMGMRGSFEEKYSGDMHRGTYVAGVWFPDKTRVGWWKIGYPEYFGKVVNTINFIGINLSVDGHEVDLAVDEVLEYNRRLDMKNGVLYRRFTVNTPSGRVEVKTERFFSIRQREIAAVRYLVRPVDRGAVIRLTPYLDGDVHNEDSNYQEKFWQQVSVSAGPGKASLTVKTKRNPFGTPRFTVCAAMGVRTSGEVTGWDPFERDCFTGTEIRLQAEKGRWVGVDKFIAVTTDRDIEEGFVTQKAEELLEESMKMGYDNQRAAHSRCWEDRWQRADVEIQGDVEAQQGIRFNIFQLLSTYYGEDSRLNIGPKGFTGEKYGGATYWDTEAFVLPMYLAIAPPEVPRNLLVYRHDQLEGACENARRQGLCGALYPMVTFTGVECHNEWEITFEEIHRNAAVAHAIYQYVNYTGDRAYLWEYGIDVLIGIARFWAARVHYSTRSGRYMLHGVTGPNEYENNVSNNWYTNRMAVWCLEYALEAIGAARDNGYAAKVDAHGVTAREEMKWREIAERMYLPYDGDLGIFVQQDTFLDKEFKSADEIPAEERPINQHWSWDRILRSCYIKQADVLQGMYFLGHLYPEEVKRKNFLFYEPMTVHESSLSPCVHAILAAELGMGEKSVEMYRRTARLDLDNYNNDTADGLHITSMSGSWLAIVQGFAGMRVTEGRLSFTPFLPEGWRTYSFKVNYRGRLLKIRVEDGRMSIRVESGEPIGVWIKGTEHRIGEFYEEMLA